MSDHPAAMGTQLHIAARYLEAAVAGAGFQVVEFGGGQVLAELGVLAERFPEGDALLQEARGVALDYEVGRLAR